MFLGFSFFVNVKLNFNDLKCLKLLYFKNYKTYIFDFLKKYEFAILKII